MIALIRFRGQLNGQWSCDGGEKHVLEESKRVRGKREEG